ncbi:MAG: endolytic transglycosylase MltG [Bacteroidales bacterium]|nr:endolytic transglycosylase MltG [Bacteroidales bacterium]
MSRKRKKSSVGRLLVWLLILVAGVLVLLFFTGRVYQDYRGRAFSRQFEMCVTPEMTPQTVLDSILALGYARDEASLKRCFARIGTDKAVKPGHYTFDTRSSAIYIARMLARGWQSPVNLTLSGTIRTKGGLARKIANQVMLDSATVADALRSPEFLAAYDTDTTMLFASIIPDTYQVYWTASLEEIFAKFRQGYETFWTPERDAKAQAIGLTREQVATLASIVDGESRYQPEQPAIAGVYLNRLRKGMKLQADPTVAFCFGYSLNRILTAHLSVDSPYNTYRYEGLPPGPISCPPKNCLDAVLNPEQHNYLFFCADPSLNGSHVFAATYTEHLVNAKAFQKALTERLRAQGKK